MSDREARCLVCEMLLVRVMLSQQEPGCSSGERRKWEWSEDVWRFSEVKVVVVLEVELRQLEPGGRNRSRCFHSTFKTRVFFFFIWDELRRDGESRRLGRFSLTPNKMSSKAEYFKKWKINCRFPDCRSHSVRNYESIAVEKFPH